MFNINKFCIESNCSNNTKNIKQGTNSNNYRVTKSQLYSQYINSPRSGSSLIKVNVPYPPDNVVGVVGNREIMLSWDEPLSIGGSKIIEYNVISVTGDININLSTQTNSVILNELTNGVGYSFVVYSKNIIGKSMPSPTSPLIFPISVPDPPTNIIINGVGNSFVNLSWTESLSNGGSPIIYYVITANETGITYISTETTITISELINNASYTFSITAVNSVGISLSSTSSAQAMPIYTVPDIPTLNTTTGLLNAIYMSWDHPINDGGTPITSYIINVAGITPVLNNLPPQSIFDFPSVTLLNVKDTNYTMNNLSYNYKYSFNVLAKNQQGLSLPLHIYDLTTKSLPDPPNNMILKPYNGYIDISWTAPENTGNTEIISYTVQCSPGNIINTVNNTSLIINNLSQTTKYTISVYATNMIGNSVKLTSLNPIYPASSPSPPRNVTVVPGNGQVAVSWVEPFDTGGLSINSYTVKTYLATDLNKMVNTPQTTNSGFNRNITIRDLINGTSYVFFVYSTTLVGNSVDSIGSVPVIPGTVPDPPTNLTILYIDYNSVNISWSPPIYDGGYVIKSYRVTSINVVNMTMAAGNNETGIITGLLAGKSYTFTITAISDYGSSESSAITITTDTTKPNPPTITSVISSDKGVTINWTLPINTGGLPINSYIINATTIINNSPVIYSQTIYVDSTIKSYLFTNLTNGIPYKFTMLAINTKGLSDSSVSSIGVVPSGAPDTPTDLFGVVIDYQTITLSWNASLNNGGYKISNYVVTITTGSRNTTYSTSNLTITISELLPGTTYIIMVVSVNINGATSAPSSSITLTTKTTTPDPPTNITGLPSNGTIVLSWIEPINKGGTPITYYTIISRINNRTTLVPTNLLPTNSAVITGLTNGTPYTFEIISTNINGDSLRSLPSPSITPIITVPDPPTNITVIPGNNIATVSWDEPINYGGTPIISYKVTALPGNIIVTINGTLNTATVSGLMNGISYCFLVVASNAAGNSLPTISIYDGMTDVLATETTIGLLGHVSAIPDQPTNIVSLPGDQRGIISWTPPINTGGMPITSYTITSTPGNIVGTTSGSFTTKTLTGLINGTSYYFSVIASNNYTSSEPATSVVGSTGVNGSITNIGIIGVPSSPTSVTSVAGNQQGTILWRPPANTGGVPISSYTVTSSPGNVVGVVSGTTTTTQLTGLTNGTSYYFSVMASNTYASSVGTNSIAGSGGVNGSTGSIGIVGAPDSPTNITSLSGDKKGTVSWTSPINTGGIPISSYTVKSSPGNVVGVVSGTETMTELTGLTNGISYYFSVMSSNTYANSLPETSIIGSSGITGTTNNIGIIGVPGQPRNIIAAPGNKYGFVSWTPPINTGGAPISSYKITTSPGNVVGVTDGVTTEAIITGLNNGTSYSFSVSASNSYSDSISNISITGSSGITGTANNIGIIGVPDPPTNVTSFPGNESGTVYWKPPINTGGVPITSYTVTSSPGNVVGVTNGTTTRQTLSGLTNGISYYFSVMASNNYANSVSVTSILGSTGITGVAGVTGFAGSIGIIGAL